jgi:LysM repeat protein
MNYINPNAPAAGLTRLLNMRDNNPATQLAYVPTKDIAAMGSMGGLEFNPYSGIPQARGIAAVADGGSIQNAPLAPVADELASRGRYGDSMLLHVRPDELQGLASLGTLTINPDTGLPEAFNFKSLLPAIGSIVGVALAPFTFGTSALAVGAMAGLGSFAGGLAAGQGVGQAALGGLMSGVTAGFMSGAPTGVDQIVGGGGGSTITGISGQGFVEGASQQALQTTLPTIAGSTAASSALPAVGAQTALSAPQAAAQFGGGMGAQTALSAPQAAAQFGGGMGAQTALPAAGAQTATALPQAPTLATGPTATAGVSRIIPPEFSVDQMTASQFKNYPAGFATESRFATIDPKTYKAPNAFEKALGKPDFTGREYITRQEYIDAGGITGDMTLGQRADQVLGDYKTYIGGAATTLMQPPEYEELDIQEPTLGPSYVPRERTLAGGTQSPARSSEEYLRMALEGGYQPLSEQYRYAAQGGLVGLAEGGQTKQFIDQPELTQMSITPESQRVRNDTSQPQQNISNRFFDELESKGGVMAMVSRLLLRNNPEAIQFVNQNASSPRNLQLNEMGGGRHSYFDTADTGLYPKAAGGLVRLVEGGTPKQGVLQSQLSPVVQQQQQTPLLQQQEQQISERARQDELLQRDQAMSRGQQFIEQPTGKQQMFQQMQNVGQVIGQQLAQGPESYATPPGQSAAPSSFVSGTSFGFNTGGLVGLSNGGTPKEIFEKESYQTLLDMGVPWNELKGIISGEHFPNTNYLTAVNDIGATGLFQFIPDTLKTLGVTQKEVTDMSAKEQADLYAKYLKTFGWKKGVPLAIMQASPGKVKRGKIKNLSSDSIIYGKESAAAKQNEQWQNKEGDVTPKSISSYYKQHEEEFNRRADASGENSEGILSMLANVFFGKDAQYKIQAGDTLSAIAKQQGMSLDELLEANKNISDPNVISRGQEITVPDQSSFLDRVRGELGLATAGNVRTLPEPKTAPRPKPKPKAKTAPRPKPKPYANGGEIGKYFEGQVVGNGDGMSDQILFEVEGNNPDKALLSRDEYVIPADVVAMLGNGSSNAGSEQLDNFIKGIRQDSFGTQKQQRQLNAQQGLRGLV